MSITDHPTDPPFGAPRRPALRAVETRPPEPATSDVITQLRDIAEDNGFKLVPADEAPSALTDVQYVANSIDTCRYLDLKGIATDILGTEKRDELTPATLADLMATWAAANKRAVQS